MSQTNVRTLQELWDAALEVFDVARDLPDSERANFIESRCAGNIELLAEVCSLLSHLQKAGNDFLKPVDIGDLIDTSDDSNSLIGRIISSFTVQSVIARGGMGTVYLARQASPRRDVALKVLSPGFWSAAAERRFAQEAQVLARLQHPNIAQVYEAGTATLEHPNADMLTESEAGLMVTASQPSRLRTQSFAVRYFAMELVPNAKKISEFADKKRLDIKERLSLFLQVCDAVQYGHSRGVIHRDLKPANILVGSDTSQASGPRSQPLVKVIDFGVARVVDTDVALTTMHTDTGQLIGTLAYMSPEQCDADPLGLDVRSDVYSLGVVLYELLCARLPYDVSKTSIAAAATTIRDVEPTRPSLIFPKLRGDIEIILLEALEKDRAKRYASVADLSRDVQHFLNREPIEARRPTRWVRVMRWAARRPKTATSVSCIALSVIVVLATYATVWFVNSRPHKLVTTLNGKAWDVINHRPLSRADSATLYSFNNRTLNEWTSPGTPNISFAALADRPAVWGGDQIVVIGFNGYEDETWGRCLCVFKAEGPYDEPIWQKTIEQDVIKAMPSDAWPRPKHDRHRHYISSAFAVTRAWMFDVFPGDEHPGPEIIAFHMHDPGSQGALRIYNLNGDVLFQAWQDGGIEECYWFAGSGILVFRAIKGDKDASQYDGGDAFEGNHCQVLIGIRPKIGDVSQRWIHPHAPDWWAGEWYQPLWCKIPCPRQNAFDLRRLILLGPPNDPRYSSANFVALTMILNDITTVYDSTYRFSCVVDENGQIMSRDPLSDGCRATWKTDQNLPNPAERPQDFQLLEWKDENPPCAQISIEFDESGSQQLEPAD